MSKPVPAQPMRPVGSKIPQNQYEALRWLAYRKNTTVSALIAGYVNMGLSLERDLIGWNPERAALRALTGPEGT